MKGSAPLLMVVSVIIFVIFLLFLWYLFTGENKFGSVADPLIKKAYGCKTDRDCIGEGKCLKVGDEEKKCTCLSDADCPFDKFCNIENKCVAVL